MAEEAELVAYWGREQRLAALEETLTDADVQTQRLLALAEEDSPQPPRRRRSLTVWRGGLGLTVALAAFVALILLAAPQVREVAAAVIHEAVKHVPAPVAIADAAPSDPLLRRDPPPAQRASRGTTAPSAPTSSAFQPSQRGPVTAGPLLGPLPAVDVVPQASDSQPRASPQTSAAPAAMPPPPVSTLPPSPPSSGQQEQQEGRSQQSPLPTPSAGLPPGLADRASLPPGLAKKKQLPPGLSKKVSPTPTPSS